MANTEYSANTKNPWIHILCIIFCFIFGPHCVFSQGAPSPQTEFWSYDLQSNPADDLLQWISFDVEIPSSGDRLRVRGGGEMYNTLSTNTIGYHHIHLEVRPSQSDLDPLDSGEYARIQYSIDDSVTNWVTVISYTQSQVSSNKNKDIELPVSASNNAAIRIRITNTGQSLSQDMFYIERIMRLTGTLITQPPTLFPSKTPTTSFPTNPTQIPTNIPSLFPTNPSLMPSTIPTKTPTTNPSITPTKLPSNNPSKSPVNVPSPSPTKSPSFIPSKSPTKIPTYPTASPSNNPTHSPTKLPTSSPTNIPTPNPTEEKSGSANESTENTVSSDDHQSQNINSQSEDHVLIIVLAVAVSVVLFCGIAIVVIYFKKKKKNKQQTNPIATDSKQSLEMNRIKSVSTDMEPNINGINSADLGLSIENNDATNDNFLDDEDDDDDDEKDGLYETVHTLGNDGNTNNDQDNSSENEGHDAMYVKPQNNGATVGARDDDDMYQNANSINTIGNDNDHETTTGK